jgi:hypothetical protein
MRGQESNLKWADDSSEGGNDRRYISEKEECSRGEKLDYFFIEKQYIIAIDN